MCGSGIRENQITRKARAKMAMAMIITGAAFETVASWMLPPTSQPTKIGAMVPPMELQEPPHWMSWLPRLPPPPSVLSIGLTTMFSRHIEKPAMKAPRTYTPKLSMYPDRNWMPTPIKPTATASSAVTL